MTALRLCGILLISSIPVIFGFITAAKSGKKLKQMKRLVELLSQIKSYIAYRSLTLDEIMSLLFRRNDFFILGFGEWNKCEYDFCTPFDKRIEKAICENKELCIDEDARLELIAFFVSLGKSDSEDQKNICTLYESKFRQYYSDVQKDCPKRQKLYCSLGILCGIFAVVILL